MAQAASDSQQWRTITKKVVLLGATAVGKTSIFNRIQQNEYIEENVTTMAAYFRPKMCEFPDEKVRVKINLWDTAGQERFQSLTRQYIQGASGVILVYDTTDETSLQGAQNWYSMLKEQIDPQGLVVAVIGNKADDVERTEVGKKDAIALGQTVGANIESQVSAKTGYNIEKMFNDIGKELIRRDNLENNRSSSMMLTGKSDKKKKGGCCGGKKKDKQ